MFCFCLNLVELPVAKRNEYFTLTLHNHIAVIRLVVLIHYNRIWQQAFHVNLFRQLYKHFKIIFSHCLEAGKVHQKPR